MSRRTSGSRRGCLPWVLGAVLLWLWFSGSDDSWRDSDLSVQQFDPRSPRRPLPDIGESFIIAEAGPQQDSQGTAFAVDSDGAWLTAQHVTTGCDRLGLARDNRVEAITDVLESREADVSILRSGPVAQFALRVADQAPASGDYGYHMGFPAGVPTVVVSRFIGAALALRGGPGGPQEPIFAWAEGDRLPAGDGPLGGISGGPTIDTAGQVVGVNAAST
ncbi:serine protease, partial [Blastomonas sp.]|uniref:S1 family peptidase n=1 Tax=Blastomonas sp. TaxID=1909299 RepID=UPI0035932B36